MWRSVLAIIFFVIGTNSALARRIPAWPYDKLAREADVVLIATASSTTDTNETLSNEPFRAELVGVETKFAVRAVLKGQLEGDTLRLLHFKLKGSMPPNGPSLIRFRTSAESKTAPEYLLFLKKRSDGRFEPVTGQIDPILSVRELH